MTYVVTVDAEVPEGAPELDALQREGVINLLGKYLDQLDAIEGPDDLEVDVLDRVIAVHPGGAIVKVFVDAPTLEIAEEAVHAVMTDILERTELLAEWTIARCEVELHEGIAQQGLDAADGPDAPPSDPAERARRHREALTGPESGKLDEAEVKAMRSKLRAMGTQLHAFPLDSFGFTEDKEDEDEEGYGPLVTQEAAEIAAGTLVYGIHLLVDELFADLGRLENDGPNVAESDEVFMVLDGLPERYVLKYDVLFVRRLVTTAVCMTARLTQPNFGPLTCVAEELLMRLLLTEAEVTADLYGLLDDDVRRALEILADEVYEDMDHEWLYQPAADGIDEDPAFAHMGIAPMGINDWFKPFNEGRFVHVYAADDDSEAATEPGTEE
ncbi:hypothetical protein OG896_17275 [Streptomyces sp. NBC_00669]|uniref:hypothetical protein n=1 Tax=Streptomyces sp. NBC_00669 TaxID=2976011 RepID=UPI002E32A882|nr:hypothetical protein [Streptomyces sp. NBC_00669]